METPRSELLATPVRTDADVLARVALIIDDEARRLRALWLFFLDADGLQNEVVVPIDCIPDLPDPQIAGTVCHVVSRLLSGTEQPDPEGSVIITLSRPGIADLSDTDRRWLKALQQGAAAYKAPIRMLCLATPGSVRELGPVAAAAAPPIAAP
jgi:hypothetical protein